MSCNRKRRDWSVCTSFCSVIQHYVLLLWLLEVSDSNNNLETHNWMSRTPQGYSKSFLGFKWEHLVQRVMISWFCKLLTSNMWKVDCVDNVKVLKWKTLQDDSCCGSLEVFFLSFSHSEHFMLYFPCQLLPVLTPFTGSLTCVDISCEWTSLGVTSKLPMGNMGRFWAPKTLQRSWFIKDHQGFARYARCCVFNLWVYTNCWWNIVDFRLWSMECQVSMGNWEAWPNWPPEWSNNWLGMMWALSCPNQILK